MPFGFRLRIAAGPAAVCFPEPDRLLPTAVVCRAFTAPGRGHLSASFFYSVGTSVLPFFVLSGAVCSSTASGFSRPGRPLFCGPDSTTGPIVRSFTARRKPPSLSAALLGHLFFRTLAGVDRQIALQGLLQPYRIDVTAQFAALCDRNAARLFGNDDDDGVRNLAHADRGAVACAVRFGYVALRYGQDALRGRLR